MLESIGIFAVGIFVAAIVWKATDWQRDVAQRKRQSAARRAEQAAEDNRRQRVARIAEQIKQIAAGAAARDVKAVMVAEAIRHPNANITDRALVEALLQGDDDPYPLALFREANRMVNPQNLESARQAPAA